MLEKMLASYLKDKEYSWAETTKHSAECSLRKTLPHLNGDPEQLWKYLERAQAPYSRVTTWVRVCGFWDFLHPKEENPYRMFRKKNKRLFKNLYVLTPAEETLDSAKDKIESISDPSIKKKALELLYTGMRWQESFTYLNGEITGKGGAKRRVYLPKVSGPAYEMTYRTVLRALKEVGLKPHTLRKIYLTECINKGGANLFELQAIAGWKSLSSAKAYIGVRPARLEEISKKARG